MSQNLYAQLDSPVVEERLEAISRLRESGSAQTRQQLEHVARADPDPRVRQAAASAADHIYFHHRSKVTPIAGGAGASMSQAQDHKRVRNACLALYFIGGLTIVLGLAAGAPLGGAPLGDISTFGQVNTGGVETIFIIAMGLFFIGCGYMVRRRFQHALLVLGIANGIYVYETLIYLLAAVGAATAFGGSAISSVCTVLCGMIVVRVLFMRLLLLGFLSLRELELGAAFPSPFDD
jgi:hypothetical protein